MFRLEKNVPEVYVNESRDFQLFCRLYDVIFNSTKFSIDSISYLSDTMSCNDRALSLLCYKLGLFYSGYDLSDTELRVVLSVYPEIMRYKGSLRSIKYILATVARLNNMHPNEFFIVQFNETDRWTLEITYVKTKKGEQLIRDLVRYVLPAGWRLKFVVVDQILNRSTQLAFSDDLYAERKDEDFKKYYNRIEQERSEGSEDNNSIPSSVSVSFIQSNDGGETTE